jgi:hypothetical protein
MSVKLPRGVAIASETAEFSAVAPNLDGLKLLIALLVLAVVAGAVVWVIVTVRARRRRGLSHIASHPP